MCLLLRKKFYDFDNKGKNRFREDVYNKGANVEVACYFNRKVFTVRRLRISILNS